MLDSYSKGKDNSLFIPIIDTISWPEHRTNRAIGPLYRKGICGGVIEESVTIGSYLSKRPLRWIGHEIASTLGVAGGIREFGEFLSMFLEVVKCILYTVCILRACPQRSHWDISPPFFHRPLHPLLERLLPQLADGSAFFQRCGLGWH